MYTLPVIQSNYKIKLIKNILVKYVMNTSCKVDN